MSRGRVFWGSLFLLAGGLLLLRNLGLLPFPLGSLFWPLLLVLLGLWLIARSFLDGSVQEEELALPREGADIVKLQLEHAAGRLTIGAGAGGDQLLRGSFAGGVRSRVRRRGVEASVRLAVPANNWFDLPFGGEGGLEWKLELSPELTYELDIKSAAGETRLGLAKLQVKALHLQTGASSTRAELSAIVDRGRVEIEAGMASVELYVPQGVAARVTSQVGLAEIDVDGARFPRVNGAFQSPEFESAGKRLEIEIQAGVGSVKVR